MNAHRLLRRSQMLTTVRRVYMTSSLLYSAPPSQTSLRLPRDSLQTVAAVGIALPRETFLTLDASYEWRDFDSASVIPVPPTGEERFDWITEVGANLRIPILMHEWGQLFCDVRYRFTNRSSNVAFYRYDRHLTDFVLTYSY